LDRTTSDPGFGTSTLLPTSEKIFALE